MKSPHYSPKQVAGSLMVSESSVKRWCDQGLIPTVRTAGGHRRITLDGLQQFLESSNRVLGNPSALGLTVTPPKPIVEKIPGGSEADQTRFRQALARGDEELCIGILDQRLRQGWTLTEAAEDLIVDAMHGVGDAWDCGKLDVYQERRGCDISIRLINELKRRLPPISESAPVAIGGAPETDPYQIATQLVSLALRECGFNAVSLGNNLPADSLVRAVVDHKPKLVWLSVSAIDNVEQFVADQNRLADSIGDDTPFLVGGQALSDELRPRLKYTAHCDTLRHLSELASIIRRQ